jgi:xanthine dehydrogenase accessory factor
MRDVIRHLIKVLEQGREPIICQVVETRGSTPQKAGSMMVVDPDGGQEGTLGGGCVENEVKSKAIQQIGGSSAVVHSFVLDHDYAWADGLICGGKMVILTHPVRGAEPLHYFSMLDEVMSECRGLTEAIVVDSAQAGGLAVGTRFLFDGENRPRARWPVGESLPELTARVEPPAQRPRPSVRGGFALLPSWPRIRLLIIGAGHVGQAVAALAAGADFDVWVVDDRHQYANPERFATAQRILVGPIDEVIRGLEITPLTYALIVTRGHGHDQEALFHLAPTAAAYVGLIGSRRKIRLIFDNLRDARISEADLARVTAPVGLDIGSQSVPEIAISIVAELIRRRNLGPQVAAARNGAEVPGSAKSGAVADAGIASST